MNLQARSVHSSGVIHQAPWHNVISNTLKTEVFLQQWQEWQLHLSNRLLMHVAAELAKRCTMHSVGILSAPSALVTDMTSTRTATLAYIHTLQQLA